MRGLVVVSRSGPATPSFEPTVDPGDDERQIERQSKDEKGDRIKEGLIANLYDRALDLVERHHDREELVSSIARRNINDVPDIGPAGDIVDPGSGHAAIFVGGNE